MEGLIGRTLGQYRIVEQIGVGGMATVFKACQPALDRYVAIKVLPSFNAKQPGFNERFFREARATASLHHPNILPVYDFGQERGYSFIVMRYVEGARTLSEVMKEPLDLAMVADIIGQVAAALDHAHARKIIHRDVKPTNVLMDGDWALLTDFGLARMTEASMKLTGTGVGIGTPAYMSPEQGQGLPVDHRTDIYSLGVILFEMLTGQIPHNAETPLAIILKRMMEPLPLPRSFNPAIPEAVERVILKALADEPGDRFASAGALAAALQQAVSGVVVERVKAPSPVVAPPSETPRPEAEGLPPMVPALTPIPAWVGFPWKWMARIGVVVVVVAGLIIALASGGRPAATPPSTAVAGVITAPASPTAPMDTSVPVPTPTPPTPYSPATETIVSSPTRTVLAPPSPTLTPWPTPVPTATPSDTPSPTRPVAKPTRPTATRPLSTTLPPSPQVATPTRLAAPSTPVGYPAPVLVRPDDGANPGSDVTFIWWWDGKLKDNEYFDLRMWREGEDHRQGVVDYKTIPRVANPNGEYVVSANVTTLGTPTGLVDRPSGEWFWSVAVMDVSNGAQDISPEAAPRKLIYHAGGGGGGGSGGGGGASGGGGGGGGGGKNPPPPPP
jgi:serine/threonine protein kinase